VTRNDIQQIKTKRQSEWIVFDTFLSDGLWAGPPSLFMSNWTCKIPGWRLSSQ